MRSVDFVAFRWLIITHMENELLDDIWRQADSDSFIVWPGPATAALYTPSYIFSSQWKIPSSFNCIWGMLWEGLMRCLSRRRSLATRTAYSHTLHGVDLTCRRWWHVPRELGSPRNDTVSLVPRLFLSLSNLDSSFLFLHFPLEEFSNFLQCPAARNVLIPQCVHTVRRFVQGKLPRPLDLIYWRWQD